MSPSFPKVCRPQFISAWYPLLLVAGVTIFADPAYAQQKHSRAYVDKKYGFSLTPPAKWEEMEAKFVSVPGEVRAVWTPDGSSTLVAFVQKSPGAVPTAKQCLDVSANVMKRLKDTELLEQETRTIAGREAMWLVAVSPGIGGAIVPGGTVRTARIWATVPRARELIVLWLTAPEAKLAKYRPAFEKAVETLKVDEAAPAAPEEEKEREQDKTPTPKQIKWLRKNAIAFDTAEAGSGFDDLKGLREIIGDARIVALGEGTHGTREFFQMKHRLVEFLASEMGFTVFSIEANMPEAYRVDDYVSQGKGDPKKLLDGMYFWTWNTQEVLDMIKWMRDFNKAGKKHIRFTGFDMQTPDVAMEIVEKYLDEADPDHAKKVRAVYADAKKLKGLGQAADTGAATSPFPVKAAAGRKVAFSAFIKTEKVEDGFAGLLWRAGGESGILAFDNMEDRGPRGTTDWKRWEVSLDIPKETTNIYFGFLLTGSGTAWFDGAEITVDGESAEAAEKFDLSFESGELKKFTQARFPYTSTIVEDVVKDGGKSLRIRRESDDKADLAADKEKIADIAKQCQEVLEHLESNRGELVKKTSEEATDWTTQNARIVHQWRQMSDDAVSRDESMARNVQWILEHSPPKTKIILWAHNGHVGRSMESMGSYLDEWYGKDMVVVGFAAHTGRYTAWGQAGLASNHKLKRPPAGSLEYALHEVGSPRLILDLRKASGKSASSSWLTKPVQFRSIGALAQDEQFFRTNVGHAFDVIIYFDKTKATQCFRVAEAAKKKASKEREE